MRNFDVYLHAKNQLHLELLFLDIIIIVIIIIIIITIIISSSGSIITELKHSKTTLKNTVEIKPQPVALDFKNLSQYSSHSN